MALVIPVNSEPDRELQIQLGENLMTVRTYYNTIAATWFMDLSGDNDVVLARGLALVPLINVLQAESELTRLYGQFRIETVNETENDNPDSLGNSATLWWFAPGEFEALDIVDTTINPLPFNVRDMYTVA